MSTKVLRFHLTNQSRICPPATVARCQSLKSARQEADDLLIDLIDMRGSSEARQRGRALQDRRSRCEHLVGRRSASGARFYRGRLRLLAAATTAGWSRLRCSSSTSLGRFQLAMTVQVGRWNDHHCTACHFRSSMAGERWDQIRCAHSEVTARLRVTICVGRSPSSARRCGSSRSQMRRSSGSSYTPSVFRAPGTAGKSNIESIQRDRLPTLRRTRLRIGGPHTIRNSRGDQPGHRAADGVHTAMPGSPSGAVSR